MKRLDVSDIIFKVLAYFFLTIFAIFCLYPFIYAISCAISAKDPMDMGEVTFLPIGFQFEAFKYVFSTKQFWLCYSNTLFLTVFAMFVSIYGAYALSKKRLPFVRILNFLLVFTMWFSAGLFATKMNYDKTIDIFHMLQIKDDKWMIVIALGLNAYNVVLLRNGFSGIPKEIEEAAIVDGASEFQIANKISVPMSKATIATVALFYGISRWNGYFWASKILKNDATQQPLQVFIRSKLNEITSLDSRPSYGNFSLDSLFYCMIVAAIVPIIVIYPFIQKYFAAGVNLGGVKE
mgnify:CR=1 FL=1